MFSSCSTDHCEYKSIGVGFNYPCVSIDKSIPNDILTTSATTCLILAEIIQFVKTFVCESLITHYD